MSNSESVQSEPTEKRLGSFCCWSDVVTPEIGVFVCAKCGRTLSPARGTHHFNEPRFAILEYPLKYRDRSTFWIIWHSQGFKDFQPVP